MHEQWRHPDRAAHVHPYADADADGGCHANPAADCIAGPLGVELPCVVLAS